MSVFKKDKSEQLIADLVISVSPVHFEHSYLCSMLIVQNIVELGNL